MQNRRLIFHRRGFGVMYRLRCSVPMRSGAAPTCRVMVCAGAVRGPRMIMPPMRWTNSGTVTGRITRRTRHSMNVTRIVPMPTIPRRRGPRRYQASSRQRGKGEHRSTCRRVPIHWLAIIITKYREAICIITGIRPAYGCTPARSAYTHRSTGIQRICIRSARTEQHRGCYH